MMPYTTNDQSAVDLKSVLIVDDHPVVRRGLASLIETDSELTVAGEASSRCEALDAIQDSQPDLVLIDLSLGKSDGLDLIKDINSRHPSICSLVVSMHDEAIYAERCLRAGAHGYVNKQQLDDTVLIAIHRVLNGETYMSAQLEQLLASKYIINKSANTDGTLNSLSDRELQVFRLIGQGDSTRKIAERLNLSIKTIESHRENIKRKLVFSNGPDLVRSAIHWIETGSFD